MSHVSRRDFLRLTGISAASMFIHGGLPKPRVGAAGVNSEAADPDIEIALKAMPSEIPIFPGTPTRVWTYRGELLKGDPAALHSLPGSYLGPIIHARQGQHIRVHVANELPEETIVHWHGLHVPEAADGHPRLAVPPGQRYQVDFQVLNRAGTYWYHPHPHMRTGYQVNNGLAGLFLVSDDEEAAAGLPAGAYDIPLVIQDRSVDGDNQFAYLSNGMMDQMNGFLGNAILVNGHPDHVLPVQSRPYRLRLLNGSNSRIYKLGWEDGSPLTVIGTDGGLLEKPLQRAYVMLSPGERIELWADFTWKPIGSELRLQSLPFAVSAMGGMMRRGASLPNGSEFTVLRVRVDQKSTESQPLPEKLSTIRRYRLEDAVNRANPRTFSIAMQPMVGTVNGRTFEMDAVAEDEVVKLNTIDAWAFANSGSGMGMMRGGMVMPHPMHIHGLQFQVLAREVSPEWRPDWESVSEGYVDEGWKDVVLLMPGEQVTLLMKFEDYTGLYMYHCHNLEHEDMGLMRNYRVEAASDTT